MAYTRCKFINFVLSISKAIPPDNIKIAILAKELNKFPKYL